MRQGKEETFQYRLERGRNMVTLCVRNMPAALRGAVRYYDDENDKLIVSNVEADAELAPVKIRLPGAASPTGVGLARLIFPTIDNAKRYKRQVDAALKRWIKDGCPTNVRNDLLPKPRVAPEPAQDSKAERRSREFAAELTRRVGAVEKAKQDLRDWLAKLGL